MSKNSNTIPLALAILVQILFACGAKTPRDSASQKFDVDSYHSVALDAVIDAGKIKTTATDPDVVRRQIISQLTYTIGLLNGWQSVSEISRSLTRSIQVLKTEPTDDGKSYWIQYRAEMTVSWSRNYQIPKTLPLILPESTDPGLNMPYAFYEKYAKVPCLDAATHNLYVGNFWYYIRPLRPGCQLSAAAQIAPLSVRIPMHLRYSALNTTNKSPEYKKIWEDKKLTVSAIFSKNTRGSESDNDAGVYEYRQFFLRLKQAFGTPIKVSHEIPGYGPGIKQPLYTAEFKTARGPLIIHTFLVDSITGFDMNFIDEFKASSTESDLILYSGHAGLGTSVQRLAELSKVVPNKYQIYLLNGCDTFAYVDDSIMRQHKEQNPDAPDYKFVDIIANSMPSLFANMSANATHLVLSMITANQTYRQILSRFSGDQHAVVFGEEDN